MELENKTDEQLQTLHREAKAERKRLQEIEREILNEMIKRDHLPELPNSYNFERPLLTSQNKIDLAKWLNQEPRTPGEIIHRIEQLSLKRR